MMKSNEQKYMEFALKCLEDKRKQYVANAVENPVLDFQRRAKEHYDELTEAIEYFKSLL